MTHEQLKIAINACLAGQDFNLSDGNWKGTPIYDFTKTCFPQGLVLDESTIGTYSDNEIPVSGVTHFDEIGADAELAFFLVEGQPHLNITFANFSSDFRLDSWLPALQNAVTQTLVWDHKTVKLTLSSNEPHTDIANDVSLYLDISSESVNPLLPGYTLTISGNIVSQEAVRFFSFWNVSSLSFEGYIAYTNEIPLLALSSAEVLNASFQSSGNTEGPQSLEIGTTADLITTGGNESGQEAMGYIMLSTRFSDFDAFAYVHDFNASRLRFGIQSSDEESSDLLSILGLFPDFDLSTLISGDFPLFDSLVLKALEIGISRPLNQLSSIRLQVGFPEDERWEIIPGEVVFGNLSADLSVFNPLSMDSRSTNLWLSAEADLSEKKFDVLLDLFSLNFSLNMQADQEIDIAAILTEVIGDLPGPSSLICSDLFVSGGLSGLNTFGGSLETQWSLLPGFVLEGLQFSIRVGSYAGITGRLSLGQINPTVVWVDAGVSHGANSTGWQFSGQTQLGLDLTLGDLITDLTNRLGVALELPSAVNELGIDFFAVSGNSLNKDLSFEGSLKTDDAWQIDLGGQSLVIGNMGIKFTHTGATGSTVVSTSGSISGHAMIGETGLGVTASFGAENLIEGLLTEIDLAGLLKDLLPDDFQVPEEFLTFEISEGSMRMEIPSSTSTDQETSFSVQLTTNSTVAFGEFCQLRASSLSIDCALDEWSLNVVGRFELSDIFAVDGILHLKRSATSGMSMSFVPESDSLAFEVPLTLPENMGGSFDMSCVPGPTAIQNNNGSWSFSTQLIVEFKGLSDSIAAVIPQSTNGILLVSSGVRSVSISGIVETATIPLPELPVPGAKSLLLGDLVLSIDDLAVKLGNKPTFQINAALGLPKELNYLFGKKGNQPEYELFRTYKAGDDTSMVNIKMGMGPSGLGFTFLSSPLADAEIVKEGEQSYFYAHLGDCGTLRLQVPDFVYNTKLGSFEAHGSCEIVDTLYLPLAVIKGIFGPAGASFPDKVPLEEIDLADSNGRLRTDKFMDFLGAAGNMPDFIQEGIETLADSTGRLPSGFTDYLSITIPEAIFYNVSIRPDGAITAGFSTYNKKIKGARARAQPARAVYPTMVSGVANIPMVGFNGIELLCVTFGPLAGGSLLQLEIDGRLDQYDIVTLMLSLMLPESKSFPLPTSDQLQKTFLFDNVFMVLPSAFPVPVPLFYDNIGLECLGIEGVNMQAHAKFPKPGSAELIQFMGAMASFFSNEKKLLKSSDVKGLNLSFVLKNDYIQLPEYMGSVTLGKKGTLAKIDVGENIAHLLNWAKTRRLDELIQAVPLKHRKGSTTISFFGISVKTSWLIATYKEYLASGSKKPGANSSNKNTIIKLDPRGKSTTKDQDVLTILEGRFTLPKLVVCEGTFGVFGSHQGSFATCFIWSCTLARIITVKTTGHVVVDPSGAMPFGVAGSCTFSIFKKPVIRGKLSLNDKGLCVSGHLDLIPGSLLQVTGDLSGNMTKSSFELKGDASVKVGKMSIINGMAVVSSKGITVSGRFLGVQTSLSVITAGTSLQMTGEMKVSVQLKAKIGPIKIEKIKVADSVNINAKATTRIKIKLIKTGFRGEISASFKYKGHTVKVNSFTVTVVPKDIDKIPELLIDQIKKNPGKVFEDVFADALKDAKKAAKEIEKGAKKAGKKVGKALGF